MLWISLGGRNKRDALFRVLQMSMTVCWFWLTHFLFHPNICKLNSYFQISKDHSKVYVIPLITAWSRGKCIPRNQQLPATCYYSETYGDLQLLWNSMQHNRRRNCWRWIQLGCNKEVSKYYRVFFQYHSWYSRITMHMELPFESLTRWIRSVFHQWKKLSN